MKCGARIAMGVAGGYFLGRTKKMKLALMLGGWAAGRQMGGPGQVFGQATKILGQSPELTALTDQVRGRLLDAGKDAAIAVATRRVEALTDRVGQRVEDLADVRRMADRDVRRVADVGGLDIASRDGEEDLEEDDFEEDRQPARRSRARSSNSQASRTTGSSRSPARTRSSATKQAAGGGRSSDQRSSSRTAQKAAKSTSPRSKSGTSTQTAKKASTTSSSRTPKKAAAGRKASRTARTQRKDRNG